MFSSRLFFQTLGDLVSIAAEVEEEFKSEELEAMLSEAHKQGGGGLGGGSGRITMHQFFAMMKVCGLIPQQDDARKKKGK